MTGREPAEAKADRDRHNESRIRQIRTQHEWFDELHKRLNQQIKLNFRGDLRVIADALNAYLSMEEL